MTTKHTPGPWFFREDSSDNITTEKLSKIIVYGEGLFMSDEGKANARLIAAAPDLLEALKLLMMDLDNQNHPDDSSITKAKDLIYKIEGKL